MVNRPDRDTVMQYLAQVSDPEVPVLSILDLGIVREVEVDESGAVHIGITPTYSGCPAMDAIRTGIRMELLSRGITKLEITEILSPAWTTDWMSEEGKAKLKAYGIAPPQYRSREVPGEEVVPCPLCGSAHTELLSRFGSTSCKALYRCLDCREPFDYFKCH